MTDSEARRPTAPGIQAPPEAVFGLDEAGQVTTWSDGARQILGWAPESVIGRAAVSLLIAPRYRERFEAVLAGRAAVSMPPRDASTIEVAAIHRDGQEVVLEVSFSSPAPGGSGAGILATCRDISDRMEAERMAAMQDAVDAALSPELPHGQVIERVLEAVCSTFGWPVGVMWRTDDAGLFYCAGLWRSPTLAGSELEELSRRAGTKADGFIADVLANVEPAWLPSLATSASPREEAARRAGLRAAGGVPVRDGRDLVGALEFFTLTDGAPGATRQTQVAAVGLRLGRHLRRAAVSTLTPARFKLDTRNTHLEFSCAFMKFMTVHGVFRDFSGWMEVGGDDPRTARGECTIRTASVDTRSVDRDFHLRSADFFAVERFPAMVYRTTQVEPLGDERFRLFGELTIRDVTRPIRLDVRLEDMETDASGVARMTLTGGTVINRIEWFLDWEKALSAGRWIVGTEVRVDLVISLVSQADRTLPSRAAR